MKYYKTITTLILSFIYFAVYGQKAIENEIISALIKSEITSLPNDTVYTKNGKIKNIRKHKAPVIIVRNETKTFLIDPEIDTLSFLKNNELPSIDLACYTDFIEKNKSQIHVDTISQFKGTIYYLSAAEINKIKNKSRKHFLKLRKGKSIVKVSRPGLNNDKTKALMYYEREWRDGLNGYGYFLLLEKVNNNWIIKESTIAWFRLTAS